MRILQICLAMLPQKPARPAGRSARHGKALSARPGGAGAGAGRDGVLGSDPYGLWALNEFLSSGSLSHR